MKKIILLMIFLSFLQCKQEQKLKLSKKEGLFKYYNEQYANYISEYILIFSGDSTWDIRKKLAFDSAFYYVNKALQDFPENNLFISRKTFLLLELHQFDEAIELTKKYPHLINGLTDYPYTEIIVNRFRAMQCVYQNDFACKNHYLDIALDLIETFLLKHKDKIKESLDCKSMSTEILNMKSPYLMPVWQYYCYWRERENKVLAINKLKEITDITIDLLQMYVNGLEFDFMHFNGI